MQIANPSGVNYVMEEANQPVEIVTQMIFIFVSRLLTIKRGFRN